MSDLELKLKNKTAVVGIVGLGYVGLPMAVCFAKAGFRVIGFDIQQKRVDMANRGISYVPDVTSEELKEALKKNNFESTTDQSRLKEADAICICVPTPLTKNKQPDLTYVTYEAGEIAKSLRPGNLVILESTTYPGTTREVLVPILEGSGLKVGTDFYLAFSPERVDPGNKNFRLNNTPKVVGGLDKRSTELATLLYEQVIDRVIPVSKPEVAEMAKLFENVFRSVNIALVNELARLCEQLDISVWEIIKAAASKPFGYMPFYPGPGVGGHCIPLDPYYLSSKALEYDFHTRFIELAAEINEQMPYHVVSRVMEILNSNGKSLKDSNILLLGVAYKKDSEDIRESPSLKLIGLLRNHGAKIQYNDPAILSIDVRGERLESVEITDDSLASADCIIIATDHSSYDYKNIAEKGKLVFDTRGITRDLEVTNIYRLGE